MLAGARGAYGCYSSVAPVPKIDPGSTDSGGDTTPPDQDSGCAPRKPWEGPGVTGVLPISDSTALVLSGELYFTADFNTGVADASDPALGKITAWRDTGSVRKLWTTAPPAFGGYPWDDPGVTAVYLTKTTGSQVIISRYRRWVHAGDQWPAAGSVVDDWLLNDAGPPSLDGAVPWEGAGVTATYFSPTGTSFYVISQNMGWMRKTTDPDPKNWTWADAGFLLSEMAPFQSAPLVEGVHPYDGKGVTTVFYLGPKLFVISVDKMWAYDGKAWILASSLKTLPDWMSAPTAECTQ
jgi:hypothetical protein